MSLFAVHKLDRARRDKGFRCDTLAKLLVIVLTLSQSLRGIFAEGVAHKGDSPL